LIFGALIGSERQVRQRMAGLRTNALVALGAASFVVFSGLYEDELSPTRVGAQVVSGIGFLGAGIIFRHGFTIHGLNTAATLWCSAAVGLISGGGAHVLAMLATGLVIFVNLGLRPLVKWLKKRTRAGMPLSQEYKIELTCAADEEAALRQAALKHLAQREVDILGFDREGGGTGPCKLDLTVAISDMADETIEAIVAPLMLIPQVTKAKWDPVAET